MITCRQLIDFIEAYLAGELPPLKSAAFRLHLVLCKSCRSYLDSYRKTIDVSKMAMTPDEPVPAAVPEELIKSIRNAMSK